ncbi:hypothetical protein VNI00_010824 [Paramarasmius palmivorus]|uniref:F-box domain-containing protein n=1 Tax=Paramarasmius palmivorus TaxID=297713 RepID=A0AAW0CF91_9AGAR
MTPAHTRSHIQSLPPEILSTIFILTNIKPYKAPYKVREPYAGQLKLNGSLVGSVCRHWRNLSLNTPALWSKIILHLYQHPCSPAIRVLERLQMHLERSKAYPLSIFLNFNRGFGFDSCLEFLKSSQPEGNVAFRLLKTIFDHVGRIRHLSLTGAFDGFFTILMPTFRDQFSNLIRLGLEGDIAPQGNRTNIANALSTFSNAQLHAIEVRETKLTSEHCIPYSHLSSIFIDKIDLTLFVTVLGANSSSLQYARVVFVDSSLPSNISIPTLSNLQTLSITAYSFYQAQSLINLFNQLTCPALDTFSFWGEDPSTFGPAISSFLARSPYLRCLYVYEHLFVVLKGIPSISILVLHLGSSGSRFIHDFATHLSTYMSTLKELKIRAYRRGFEWAAFKGMVTAFWECKKAPRLQSVYLSISKAAPPDDIVIWVRDMQIQGRVIRIYSDCDEYCYDIFKYRLPGISYKKLGYEVAEE